MKTKIFKCLSVFFFITMLFGFCLETDVIVGYIIQFILIMGSLFFAILFCCLIPKEEQEKILQEEDFDFD